MWRKDTALDNKSHLTPLIIIMSDIIQLLPDSVANQIAAGEVIQRPASVVKELVENALDAGAKTINVIVVDAGRTSIQVIDDGSGMSVTDARLSFERHATSKIRTAGDLFDLHTMGFRGEALASIAAVAQVELRTRRNEDEVGTLLTISGSKFKSQEPVSCPVGSNFKIENLFFNVPARRKFLKSNSTELNNIMAAFERIVLVNPQVTFTFHSNGTELLHLPATGKRQRIVDVFGKRINQELLPVAVDTSLCKISGFVGKPESARKKGAHQFFFVNNRFMKHAYFNKAVMTPFERLVPQGEQVPYFIFFEVAPSYIDVNIHPTKTEIKFENEQPIWQVLSAAVKEAIGKFNDVPSIDFDTFGRPDIPVYNPLNTEVSTPRVPVNPQYNPFKQTPRTERHSQIPANWQVLYQDAHSDQEKSAPGLFDNVETAPPSAEKASDIIADKSLTHYQYKGRYIMTAVKSGLMIIDQHRAHLRVLYEEYKEKMASRRWCTQHLLFPETIECSPAEALVLTGMISQLAEVGFVVKDNGDGHFLIEGIPAGIEEVPPVQLLRTIIASAQTISGDLQANLGDPLALSMARAAAIPVGQALTNAEMENLVNRLFGCSNVNMTPDGKLILCILRQEEIERMLGL